MLQQRQFQQCGQITHQLRGDNQHQNGDQHRSEGDRLHAFHPLNRRRNLPEMNIFQEREGRVDFRPQEDHRDQRDQRQQRTHQPQRLGRDGIQIHHRFLNLDRAFIAGADLMAIFLTAGALIQHFRTALLGAFEGDTTSLNQHPAADNVINHQQHEPDGDRGFQAGQQRL
ncbi:hypothetical protein SRABI106_03490 [Rahnella aquatilis]|nr:hypothetical protein SRABI106_03490 [Rahnella aquatilis]